MISLAKKREKGALTLIEILVVSAIFLMLTIGILFSNQGFNNAILVTNLAYEIALTIRESQVYGLSVQGFEGSVSTEFDIGYGTYFTDGSDTSYIFFADQNEPQNNFRYDGPVELVNTFTLTQGNVIQDFCAYVGGVSHCRNDGDISELNIVFVRPDPNAYITSNVRDNYERAEITVRSPKGMERVILAENTGQIAVLSESAVTTCMLYPPGHSNYCRLAPNGCGPCQVGEGDCDNDSECFGSLVCDQQSGTDFCAIPPPVWLLVSGGEEICTRSGSNRLDPGGNGITGDDCSSEGVGATGYEWDRNQCGCTVPTNWCNRELVCTAQ